MKALVHFGLSMALLLTLAGIAVAEEIDPFAEPPPSEKKDASPGEFETTGGFKVSPEAGNNPECVAKADWPKVEAPTEFNRQFISPEKVWKVNGGYFAAFDVGEWGGALFFAVDGAKKWTRIIDDHIQDLECFEGDSFLASGGLAHLNSTSGAAHLITRLPSGEWQARMVFHSDAGVPRIVGLSATEGFMKAESKTLIVLGLEEVRGCSPCFGIDVSGATHYLGENAGKRRLEEVAPSSGNKPPK